MGTAEVFAAMVAPTRAACMVDPVELESAYIEVKAKLADLRAGCSVSGDALEARKQANRTSAAYCSFFLFFLL